jgi:transcriptional regulator with XRE-family HTH domain
VEPRERFSANLRAARKKAGQSQETVGHASDLHPTEISKLERSTRDPRLTTLVKLARALKTTPSELLKGVR